MINDSKFNQIKMYAQPHMLQYRLINFSDHPPRPSRWQTPMQHALLHALTCANSSLRACDSAGEIVRIEPCVRASSGRPCTPGPDFLAEMRSLFSEERFHELYRLTWAETITPNGHILLCVYFKTLLYWFELLQLVIYGLYQVHSYSLDTHASKAAVPSQKFVLYWERSEATHL